MAAESTANAANASGWRDLTRAPGYEFVQGSGYALPQYPFVPPPELQGGAVRRHPVVIVGAGISGLTLACALAQWGVDCLLLDEDDTVGVKGASSRGICYAQKSLEIYRRLGIYERIAERGVQWSVGRTFAGHDEVYSFDLRQRRNLNLSTQPAFINIQQFYIEAFLVDRIGELGHAQLRWKNRVVGFEQNEAFATLEVETPAGRYRLQAEHVIDCSGVHSPFRRWLGVAIDAQRGDDRWCIADVRFKEHPPVERHTWIEAPFNDDRAVWQHLMADDVWRLDYQMEPNCDMAEFSREDVVRARIARQLGAHVEYEIVWIGPYAYRSECLQRFRHGRVFMVGDAAHVVSPFGARGGNSGLQDADNLAWKLAAVLQGRAAPALLDSYDAERRAAAQDNVRVTRRTARFLRPPTPTERRFRDAAIALARSVPFGRQYIDTGRMSVANDYPDSPVCAAEGGKSVQNVPIGFADGTRGELVDLLLWAGPRLLLLLFGRLNAPTRKRLTKLTAVGHVRAVQVLPEESTGDGGDCLETVFDVAGSPLAQACGVEPRHGAPAYALLRPDGYLAARGTGVEAGLVRHLAAALALPH
jgi:3-(3-hydroxy-phenyl)propionate hydroxylase